MAIEGLVAGDRFARRRWPELREIRKAESTQQAQYIEAQKRLSSEAARAKLTALSYAPVTVRAGSVILRCATCGAENPRRVGAPAGQGAEGQWTGQSLKGLPMSRGVQWIGMLAAIAFLGIGVFRVAIVLGLLFFSISPLLPMGDYLFGRRAPIYLTACQACGGRIAFAGAGDSFLAAATAPAKVGEDLRGKASECHSTKRSRRSWVTAAAKRSRSWRSTHETVL
jgi:hypothetical protein